MLDRCSEGSEKVENARRMGSLFSLRREQVMMLVQVQMVPLIQGDAGDVGGAR